MKVLSVAPLPKGKHSKRMLKLMGRRINAAEQYMADLMASSIYGKPVKKRRKAKA
jgi:hypothetical protein